MAYSSSMYRLGVSEALKLVRKNMDELRENDSDILGDTDSEDFEAVFRKTLPEAIDIVHSNAPIEILNGMMLNPNSHLVEIDNDGVLTISLDEEVLRLIKFKARNSPYPISQLVLEQSPEGRMQLNPYTMGSYDRPVMVLCQGGDYQLSSHNTRLKYYCVKGNYPQDPLSAIEEFEYIPYYRYTDTVRAGGSIPGVTPNSPVMASPVTAYDVASRVVSNIIDQVTGMMLTIFNNESATIFLTRASFNKPKQEQ